jgi:hypothetical protein
LSPSHHRWEARRFPDWSTSVRLRGVGRTLCSEAYGTRIRALLVGMAPPCIIFAPGRRPAVLVRLQTADHIRLPSPVQEEQGTPAPGHWARIMRFAMGEQEEPLALLCPYHRQRLFSALLHSHGCLLLLCADTLTAAPPRSVSDNPLTHSHAARYPPGSPARAPESWDRGRRSHE